MLVVETGARFLLRCFTREVHDKSSGSETGLCVVSLECVGPLHLPKPRRLEVNLQPSLCWRDCSAEIACVRDAVIRLQGWTHCNKPGPSTSINGALTDTQHNTHSPTPSLHSLHSHTHTHAKQCFQPRGQRAAHRIRCLLRRGSVLPKCEGNDGRLCGVGGQFERCKGWWCSDGGGDAARQQRSAWEAASQVVFKHASTQFVFERGKNGDLSSIKQVCTANL